MNRHQRGAILLETLIALALFIGAASFTLGALHRTIGDLERAELESTALDLARSKMAELESGLIHLNDLRDTGSSLDRVGSVDYRDPMGGWSPLTEHWELDVTSEPTEFSGLSLVEITVLHLNYETREPDGLSVALRQLVRLVEAADESYEEDEMLEGLPNEERRP